MAVEKPTWNEEDKAHVYCLADDIEIRDYGEYADDKSGQYEVSWPTNSSPSELLQALEVFREEAHEKNETLESEDGKKTRSHKIELIVEGGLNLSSPNSQNRITGMHIETEFGGFDYDNDGEDKAVQFISDQQLAYPLSKFILTTTSDTGIDQGELMKILRVVGRKKAKDPSNMVMDNLRTNASLLDANEDISLN